MEANGTQLQSVKRKGRRKQPSAKQMVCHEAAQAHWDDARQRWLRGEITVPSPISGAFDGPDDGDGDITADLTGFS